MKKKIVTAILMMAALTACSNKEEPRGPLPSPTEEDEATAIDTSKPEPTEEPAIDVPGGGDDPEVITEEPGPEDDELIFGECKAERNLQTLDVSELPGDIGRALSVFADYSYTMAYDHTDIEEVEQRLAGFIDRGTEMYQFDGLRISKDCFVSGDKEDPLGGYTEYGFYFSVDKKDTDRWFAALYNCTEDDIEKINKKWDSSTALATDQRYDDESGSLVDISMRRDPYLYDDQYYFYDVDSWADVVGAQGRVAILEPIREIYEIAYDGVFYYIRFNEYDAWDYYTNNESTVGLDGIEHDAVFKWKEQDGKQFWSLYYMDMGKFPER